MRFGSAAIVGRANVGKSTFLNAVLDQELAIVSPLPQTTRDTLLGIVDRPEAQIAFLDTPGLARPKNELGRRTNALALEAARAADVVVMMTDLSCMRRDATRSAAIEIEPADRDLFRSLPAATPSVLVVNKIDQLQN